MSSCGDQTTKEQASQTHDSLLETHVDQEEFNLKTENFSTLSNPSSAEVVSGPDTTALKQIASDRASDCDTPSEGQGQQTRTDDMEAREYYQDHQCAHEEGLLENEHELHPAKQEQQGRRKPIVSQDSAEEDTVYLRKAHLAVNRPHSGESCAFSASLSSNCSSLTYCDTCSAAETSMPCLESMQFWKSVPGLKCCERVWNTFHERLKQKFSQETALKQARVIQILKVLLGVTGTLDYVHISKFLEAVKFLGPFRCEQNRCVIIQQLEHLVSNSNTTDPRNRKKKICWFAGPMTRTQAIEKLQGKAAGTYLIRMSSSEGEDGSFALSLVMEDETIEHFLLKGHPEEAVKSSPFSLCLEFHNKRFSSLPELVNSYLRQEEISDGDSGNATRCKSVCTDLPFNHIINGYK